MYGQDYVLNGTVGEDPSMAKFDEALDFLRERPPGVFLDYGCGDGRLLQEVRKLGWDVIGVEFDPDVVNQLAGKIDAEVIGPDEAPSRLADVVHLGDVLEHLTDLEKQMPKVMSLVKKDGLVIAHGPLEANPSFFNRVLKLSRKLKGGKITSIPPYHVIMATTNGQRELFRLSGLSEIRFDVAEIAFPAPGTLAETDLKQPRSVMLYLTRKVSQAITTIRGAKYLGNRYFFIGKKT